MNILKQDKNQRIAIIGGGVIGMSIAWKLSSNGFEVALIDPHIKNEFNRLNPQNGTAASLGVLMGYIFKKDKGRSYELRKKSLELWKDWPNLLNTGKEKLQVKTPLIKLARSEEEANFLERLCYKRKNEGLVFLRKESNIGTYLQWEYNNYGGVISNKDGQVDPILLQKCLMRAINKNYMDFYSNVL